MPVRLGDLQADVTAALVQGQAPACADHLVGGREPTRRFAIHQRHYQSSVARAIVDRFPATVWLVGSEFVAEAALAFVRESPPEKPCIAEYGAGFPRFLADQAGAAGLPYLEQFATIDWHLGALAIAVDEAPVHLRVDWSLDELFGFFLSGHAPDAYVLRAETVWLELRGARGELSIQRQHVEV
jgi:hypothetical protein